MADRSGVRLSRKRLAYTPEQSVSSKRRVGFKEKRHKSSIADASHVDRHQSDTDIDIYIRNNGPYCDLLHNIISSHNSGHGWRFGVDHIKDTYKNDYKILSLHEKITSEYGKSKQLLSVLKRMIEIELEECIESKSKVNSDTHWFNAMELTRRVDDLENDVTFNTFQSEVVNILDEYKRTGTIRSILSFKTSSRRQVHPSTSLSHASVSPSSGSRVLGDRRRQSTDWKVVKESSEKETRKGQLVEQYINIASKYAYLTITKVGQKTTNVQFCCSCESEIEKDDECTSGLIVCSFCHAENPVTFNNSMNRDDISHMQAKDDSISNFENALKKYMGLQDPPQSDLIDRLNAYMKSRNYPTSEDVWDLPLTEFNKRGKTSCKMIIDALSSIKEVKHYEDVHLIGSMLWNWALPDLRNLKETILYHFRATQGVFNSMPKEERGRNSALGIQFRLYAHLWAVGHKCRFEDFKIPNSSSSLEIHMNNWRYMCKNSAVQELVNLGELPTTDTFTQKIVRRSIQNENSPSQSQKSQSNRINVKQ